MDGDGWMDIQSTNLCKFNRQVHDLVVLTSSPLHMAINRRSDGGRTYIPDVIRSCQASAQR